uniref:isoleucine--tRNA ligase n=1 Tax=Globodera pallida TaxID=36090 RepID=A0A183C260_GLOPA
MASKSKSAAAVLLPKTKFSVMVKGIERSKLDKRLAALGQFESFYRWQRQRPQTAANGAEDFVLLDGPPYANGEPHVGHAINKLLKDFILRSRVQLGQRVRYRPGWDCHGLPIELKIQRQQLQQIDQQHQVNLPSTSSVVADNPLLVRHSARQVANASIRSQMDTFLAWGCIGDFARPYLTMQPAYVGRQLELFAQLFDKGLVRRALQPVYWSPSSRTALAESELEYNLAHKSTAVYFRFQLINFDLATVRWVDDEPLLPTRARPVHVYALVWTTTPWTLPMNNAIAVNPGTEYALIDFPKDRTTHVIRNMYIVASALVPHISKEFGFDIAVLGTLSGAQFADNKIFYKNPRANVQALPVLSASFVNQTTGTGLVHVAYAHGQDDYELGLSQEGQQRIACFVDERGRYTREMGHELCWKDVLGDGQRAALKCLQKDILHQSEYVHSYPYDWRTNQPVIIRCSPQWFIDVKELSKRCLVAAEGESPALQIASGTQDLRAGFTSLFQHRRDWWCVSRQRVWGVPIPAIRHRDTGEVRTNSEFIRSIAHLLLVAEQNGTESHAEKADIWWTMPLEEMAKLKGFPFGADQLDNVEKLTEVMDVWLDSGLSWHTLNKEENGAEKEAKLVADLVVEGVDQFRGWFQTSSLTSMALQDCAPFKQILVHAMAVDDQGKKMSKSKGNVVDPKTITGCDHSFSASSSSLPNGNADAIGVDGLRLWCAWLASDSSGSVSIGPKTLKLVETRLQQIRRILRFILGSLESAAEAKRKSGTDLADLLSPIRNPTVATPEGPCLFTLMALDRYILAELDDFMDLLADFRLNYRFGAFVEQYYQFLHNRLSSQYIYLVRDRLYCDPVNSVAHDAVLITLDVVGQVLVSAIAPILPHLATEYFAHHPTLRHQPAEAFRQAFMPETGIELLRRSSALQNAIGDRAELARMMDAVRDIRKKAADDEASKVELRQILNRH